MSEQEYEISSSSPLLFFSDNEISFDEFEQEKVSLEDYNEIFNDNNNDIYLKDFEVVENEKEQDNVINYVDDIKNIEFTLCIIIDFVKVDRKAIKEVNGILLRLGMCDFNSITSTYINHRINKVKMHNTLLKIEQTKYPSAMYWAVFVRKE
ncbi:hypothetical protein C1646_766271 [Rhizophagus diaphanus]|nr:hypothetical protein C1646_766271 [Rhizophagus diaphanus] [Rhizophagus sp. MUCL 43196]